MSLHTILTERLGIEIPVVQPGMQWVGLAELAAAVSNAGGLGVITGLTQPTPEDLRKEIRRCKSMTSKPFGVNLTLLPALNPPDYPGYAKVIVEEDIKVVETAGNGGPVIKIFKEAGVIVMHKVTTIRHALAAEKMGVDFISIDGFEAAGHIGSTDVAGMVLLRRAAQSLTTPFIASGGFADGQGLAAALALGACGVNMGTRFMCTVEAPIHHNIKLAIVKGAEGDTELVLRKWNNTARYYKNEVAKEAKMIESTKPNSEFKDVAHLVAGARGKRVFIDGDAEAGVWTVGPAMGVVQDVPTCKELLDRIVAEANSTIATLGNLGKKGSKL